MMVALALLAAAPSLWLSLPAAGETPCSAARFAAAVQERRPGLEVREGDLPRPEDASARIEHEGSSWSLTVQVGSEPALHRSLPAPGPDCLVTASTAALMIDRALDNLRWSGSPVRLAPLEEASSTPLREPARDLAPPLEGRVEVGLGIGTSFGSWLPALSLELSAQRGLWSLGLGGALSGSSTAPVGGDPAIGAYAVRGGDLRAMLGHRFPLGPGAVCAEALAGAALARGNASGPLLAQESPGLEAGLFLGARLGYELELPGRFGLALRAEGSWLPRALSFAVQGYPGALSSSNMTAGAALSVWRNFF